MKHEQAVAAMTNIMAKFTDYIGKHLPDDILDKLRQLRSAEESPLAKVVYDSMFENLTKADALDRPCCQDTGVIQFFIEAGADFADKLNWIIVDAIKATGLANNGEINAADVELKAGRPATQLMDELRATHVEVRDELMEAPEDWFVPSHEFYFPLAVDTLFHYADHCRQIREFFSESIDR